MLNFTEEKPLGKLGVLIVGINGAVSTTFLAGTMAVRRGLANPVGSFTQMAHIPESPEGEKLIAVKDLVMLADLDDIVFGGWDIRQETALEGARYAEVLSEKDINRVADELQELKPFPAVFDRSYVSRLEANWVKKGASKFELMEALRDDIRSFKDANCVERVVVIWCASTEAYHDLTQVHSTIQSFEKGMRENDPDIAPSMLYAYAAISEGVPFIMGAPNLANDCPAIREHALKQGVPICGKDFKTGQTLVKTTIAPMLRARMLGLRGWFSTNILGNRDGEVLDAPENFKTKEKSKLSVLGSILRPDLYPELYKEAYHKVRINYYPPRGDNKEGWDNLDIFGWLDYPMQIKIDFLCKDSILAAPIVLDLVLLADLAQRRDCSGIQTWLSFYFKSPLHGMAPAENDLFKQLRVIEDSLRDFSRNTSLVKEKAHQGNGHN